MKTTSQGRRTARHFFQFPQREFDMLAGPKRVDGEIGTGTIIHSRPETADGNAVGVPALGIGDGKIGEKLFSPQIFQPKLLLLAEFPPQGDLPLLQRHPLRFPGAGRFFDRLGF